jgi:hypothetical protein
METYNSLNNISKVIRHCDKQSALLRVIGANLVDPTENQGTRTVLNILLDSVM